jgi:hypothetical protein
MPSGDSSPCIRMNSGYKRGERVHGDESPDAINRVPTPVAWSGEWVQRIVESREYIFGRERCVQKNTSSCFSAHRHTQKNLSEQRETYFYLRISTNNNYTSTSLISPTSF